MKKLWTLFLVLVFSACLISPAITTDVYAADGVVMTVNGTDYTNHNAYNINIFTNINTVWESTGDGKLL